jgi:hypothetical protein
MRVPVHKASVRPARPGDTFVLLLPAADEIAGLCERQKSLQSRFGGRPHEPVHLTCQRFELPEERPLPSLLDRLRLKLAGVPAFPIVATSIVQMEHPFWETRLLRWQIRGTRALRHFVALVDECLVEMGIRPHYPLTREWGPGLVTALEQIPKLDPDRELDGLDFPHPLFTARQVVISRIKGQKQFEVLGRLGLTEPTECRAGQQGRGPPPHPA